MSIVVKDKLISLLSSSVSSVVKEGLEPLPRMFNEVVPGVVGTVQEEMSLTPPSIPNYIMREILGLTYFIRTLFQRSISNGYFSYFPYS